MNIFLEIKNRYLLFLLMLLLYPLLSLSQEFEEKDFSIWCWFQLEKKVFSNQYAQFQYQVRFNENASQFNRGNLYFIYGVNFLRNWQLEALYQLNTNHRVDQHTFFSGLTFKQKLTRRTSIFYRTSYQVIRNGFTGDVREDKPYSELRNRLRIIYRINNLFSSSISAEPYLKLSFNYPTHLSRIRIVNQFNYKFNKYQDFSLFYMIQPDIVSFKKHEISYVLGFTYHIKIPNKSKGFYKFFKSKKLIKESIDDYDLIKDTYN